MSDPASLGGMRVLVTRPAEQADTLCRLIERHGGRAIRLPMQAIEPTRQAAAAAAQLQQQREALAWIFTSVNAVRYARGLDAGVWPPCIAIGPATASALEQAGIVDVRTPAQRHDSEAVLALDVLQDVADRSIVIVTGEGGRDALEQGLAARGAQVSRVEVYRRVALPHTAEALTDAVVGADAAVITNGEALRLLFARVDDDARLRLLHLQLVVPSRRVVEQALDLGFVAEPLVPEQVGDAAVVRTLEQWWAARGRNPRMTDQDQNKQTSPPKPEPDRVAAAPVRPPPPSPAPARRGGGAWWGLLWSVLVLALVAAAGWEGYRRIDAMIVDTDARVEDLKRDFSAISAQVDRMQTRGSDQSVAVQRNAAEIARFSERLAAQDEAIGRLRDELGGGRARVQLAVVEQLLMLANDRLQLGREVSAAVTALDAADARLATLADPRLFSVREAIARERAALLAVPRADAAGAALTLSSLIDRAPRFALKTTVPEHFEAGRTAPPPATEVSGPWQRAQAAVRRALASTFTLRRDSGPPRQLLTDEQTALIRQVLALKLEGARAALLRRDAASFRELCRSATAWLDDYFNANDPGIAAAQSELARLQTLDLEPPLPDLGGSLSLLRAQLEAPPQ
jgi:uroporphyrinogen-III synthase/uncharacterized protein HemX